MVKTFGRKVKYGLNTGFRHGFKNVLFSRFFFGFVASLAMLISSQDKAGRIKDNLDAKFNEQEDTFDFIVVGGGTAGSLLANRLSEQHKVLLLEAGGEPHPLQRIPGMSLFLLNHREIDWMHRTVPQRRACFAAPTRRAALSQGMNLGGSSNLGFMAHLRGSPRDFDHWAKVTEDESWTYDSLLPYFRRHENYVGDSPDREAHGFDGELKLEVPSYTGMAKEFIRAGQELGYEHVDLNARYDEGFDTIYYPLEGGERRSAFSAFLEPCRDRDTLIIRKYAHVNKLLIRGHDNTAYGVEYDRHGRHKHAYATKEVILSAGAVESAKLLMLSGIGPKTHLADLGIPVISDVPVGKNLQDHLATMIGPFFIDPPRSYLIDRDVTVKSFYEYKADGNGPMSSSLFQAAALISSKKNKWAGSWNWPDIQLLLSGLAGHKTFATDVGHAFNLSPKVLKKYYDHALGRDSFFIAVTASRPYARGEIVLEKRDPYAPLSINPHYLENEHDLGVMIEGVKTALYLVENTTSFQNLRARFTNKKFPGCDHMNFRSDEYFECYIRHLSVSLSDFVGTCAMGSEKDGVLDSELQVRGVKHLRVVDSSVMPTITGSPVGAAVLAIAEKAADIIHEAWRTRRNNEDVHEHDEEHDGPAPFIPHNLKDNFRGQNFRPDNIHNDGNDGPPPWAQGPPPGWDGPDGPMQDPYPPGNEPPEGWGPPNQNPGWGPPNGFGPSGPPSNMGPGPPPNMGPGPPPNMGPGPPPNMGPGPPSNNGGPPPSFGPGPPPNNMGPGPPPNFGPDQSPNNMGQGPPPNFGPGPPPNMGSGPPNNGQGPPPNFGPPNMGPGPPTNNGHGPPPDFGPPNMGPGSGPPPNSGPPNFNSGPPQSNGQGPPPGFNENMPLSGNEITPFSNFIMGNGSQNPTLRPVPDPSRPDLVIMNVNPALNSIPSSTTEKALSGNNVSYRYEPFPSNATNVTGGYDNNFNFLSMITKPSRFDEVMLGEETTTMPTTAVRPEVELLSHDLKLRPGMQVSNPKPDDAFLNSDFRTKYPITSSVEYFNKFPSLLLNPFAQSTPQPPTTTSPSVSVMFKSVGMTNKIPSTANAQPDIYYKIKDGSSLQNLRLSENDALLGESKQIHVGTTPRPNSLSWSTPFPSLSTSVPLDLETSESFSSPPSSNSAFSSTPHPYFTNAPGRNLGETTPNYSRSSSFFSTTPRPYFLNPSPSTLSPSTFQGLAKPKKSSRVVRIKSGNIGVGLSFPSSPAPYAEGRSKIKIRIKHKNAAGVQIPAPAEISENSENYNPMPITITPRPMLAVTIWPEDNNNDGNKRQGNSYSHQGNLRNFRELKNNVTDQDGSGTMLLAALAEATIDVLQGRDPEAKPEADPLQKLEEDLEKKPDYEYVNEGHPNVPSQNSHDDETAIRFQNNLPQEIEQNDNQGGHEEGWKGGSDFEDEDEERKEDSLSSFSEKVPAVKSPSFSSQIANHYNSGDSRIMSSTTSSISSKFPVSFQEIDIKNRRPRLTTTHKPMILKETPKRRKHGERRRTRRPKNPRKGFTSFFQTKTRESFGRNFRHAAAGNSASQLVSDILANSNEEPQNQNQNQSDEHEEEERYPEFLDTFDTPGHKEKERNGTGKVNVEEINLTENSTPHSQFGDELNNYQGHLTHEQETRDWTSSKEHGSNGGQRGSAFSDIRPSNKSGQQSQEFSNNRNEHRWESGERNVPEKKNWNAQNSLEPHKQSVNTITHRPNFNENYQPQQTTNRPDPQSNWNTQSSTPTYTNSQQPSNSNVRHQGHSSNYQGNLQPSHSNQQQNYQPGFAHAQTPAEENFNLTPENVQVEALNFQSGTSSSTVPSVFNDHQGNNGGNFGSNQNQNFQNTNAPQFSAQHTPSADVYQIPNVQQQQQHSGNPTFQQNQGEQHRTTLSANSMEQYGMNGGGIFAQSPNGNQQGHQNQGNTQEKGHHQQNHNQNQGSHQNQQFQQNTPQFNQQQNQNPQSFKLNIVDQSQGNGNNNHGNHESHNQTPNSGQFMSGETFGTTGNFRYQDGNRSPQHQGVNNDYQPNAEYATTPKPYFGVTTSNAHNSPNFGHTNHYFGNTIDTTEKIAEVGNQNFGNNLQNYNGYNNNKDLTTLPPTFSNHPSSANRDFGQNLENQFRFQEGHQNHGGLQDVGKNVENFGQTVANFGSTLEQLGNNFAGFEPNQNYVTGNSQAQTVAPQRNFDNQPVTNSQPAGQVGLFGNSEEFQTNQASQSGQSFPDYPEPGIDYSLPPSTIREGDVSLTFDDTGSTSILDQPVLKDGEVVPPYRGNNGTLDADRVSIVEAEINPDQRFFGGFHDSYPPQFDTTFGPRDALLSERDFSTPIPYQQVTTPIPNYHQPFGVTTPAPFIFGSRMPSQRQRDLFAPFGDQFTTSFTQGNIGSYDFPGGTVTSPVEIQYGFTPSSTPAPQAFSENRDFGFSPSSISTPTPWLLTDADFTRNNPYDGTTPAPFPSARPREYTIFSNPDIVDLTYDHSDMVTNPSNNFAYTKRQGEPALVESEKENHARNLNLNTNTNANNEHMERRANILRRKSKSETHSHSHRNDTAKDETPRNPGNDIGIPFRRKIPHPHSKKKIDKQGEMEGNNGLFENESSQTHNVSVSSAVLPQNITESETKILTKPKRRKIRKRVYSVKAKMPVAV